MRKRVIWAQREPLADSLKIKIPFTRRQRLVVEAVDQLTEIMQIDRYISNRSIELEQQMLHKASFESGGLNLF